MAGKQLGERDAADVALSEARAERLELRHIDLMKHVRRHRRQPAHHVREEAMREEKVMWQSLAHDQCILST